MKKIYMFLAVVLFSINQMPAMNSSNSKPTLRTPSYLSLNVTYAQQQQGKYLFLISFLCGAVANYFPTKLKSLSTLYSNVFFGCIATSWFIKQRSMASTTEYIVDEKTKEMKEQKKDSYYPELNLNTSGKASFWQRDLQQSSFRDHPFHVTTAFGLGAACACGLREAVPMVIAKVKNICR